MRLRLTRTVEKLCPEGWTGDHQWSPWVDRIYAIGLGEGGLVLRSSTRAPIRSCDACGAIDVKLRPGTERVSIVSAERPE